ncbi:soleucyl-tRNA synthetase [Babesia gibsoni]|uniref:isoleucine--tRNA ligase n=1 Tax=Babesia gibsoni TaxID=33632 RepID=A0AAD8LK23_BABGI|nr:soleucyl-tRNA synthetase [Babesia gibsoni]
MWLRGSLIVHLFLWSSLSISCYQLNGNRTVSGGIHGPENRYPSLVNRDNHGRQHPGASFAYTQDVSPTPDMAYMDDKEIEESLNLPQNLWPKRKHFIKAALERQIRIQKFWKDNDIYRYLLQRRMSNFCNKSYSETKVTKLTRVILDGPPYANGDAHYGHFLNKTIKDVLLKAALLEGKLALFLPGWDCHGIPIESKVLSATEDKLGDLRRGITDAGIPRAVDVRQRCSQVASRSIQSQTDTFERSGVWGFWKEFYATYHFYYEKKVMESFLELHDRKLIYRARCPQNYSVASKSVLADSELLSEERDVLTAVVAFKIVDPKPVLESLGFHRPLAAVKLACWTTLPWTIPGNRGLLINGDLEYDVYYRDGTLYLLNNNDDFGIFEQKQHVGKVTGETLVGLKYLHPFTDAEYEVHDHDGIMDNKGTGIVHSAPAHGFLDFRLLASQKNFTIKDTFVNDPNVVCNIIDENEVFYKGVHLLLDGKSIRDVNSDKLRELLGDDLLHHSTRRVAVDVDWRYGNQTHVRITKQWCLSLRERNVCLDNLKNIKMEPEASRNYLNNIILHRAKDWCISRQRVWGTPIPIAFVSNEALENEELSKLCSFDERAEGHMTGEYRIAVDIETLPNYELGDRVFRKMQYHTDTVDVWFESALAQRVTLSRLREILRDLSRSAGFAKDFAFKHISPEYAVEGQDQFRGWYQSSMLLNSMLGGDSPIFARRMITHGFVKDDTGKKLSKRNQKQETSDGASTQAEDSGPSGINENQEKLDDGSQKKPDCSQHSSSSSVDSTCGINTVTGKSLMSMIGSEYYDDPELVDLDSPKCVGADILRLWVCSNDFLQKDIRLNPANLSEAHDFAKKVANFFKYAIGVTHDCKITNDRCRLRAYKFNALDIHFLKLSYDLVKEARVSFREGKFHRVVRELEMFLKKFSTIYISYCKDSLYCDVKHGFKRTSAQIIIRRIMRNVLSVVAPLMPHMAEDVFQTFNHHSPPPTKRKDPHKVKSVFGERWYKIPHYLERIKIKEGITLAMDLRTVVNSMNSKTDNQDLIIVCTSDEHLHKVLKLETKYKLDLRQLFNVAEVKLRLAPEKGMEQHAVRHLDGYSLYLVPSSYKKCKRCWLYRGNLKLGFCERCAILLSTKTPESMDSPQEELVENPDVDAETPFDDEQELSSDEGSFLPDDSEGVEDNDTTPYGMPPVFDDAPNNGPPFEKPLGP